MYVCVCQGITERQIRAAIRDGACSMRDLRRELGVSASCGRCGVHVRDILNGTRALQRPAAVDVGTLAYPVA